MRATGWYTDDFPGYTRESFVLALKELTLRAPYEEDFRQQVLRRLEAGERLSDRQYTLALNLLDRGNQ